MQKNPLIGGLLTMKKLWENPSPTASFSPAQISVDQTDCDLLLYYYYESSSYPRILSAIAPVGKDSKVCCVGWGSNNKMLTTSRITAYVDSTHISIGNAYYNITTSDVGTNNGYLIPYQIYGIKIG